MINDDDDSSNNPTQPNPSSSRQNKFHNYQVRPKNNGFVNKNTKPKKMRLKLLPKCYQENGRGRNSQWGKMPNYYWTQSCMVVQRNSMPLLLPPTLSHAPSALLSSSSFFWLSTVSLSSSLHFTIAQQTLNQALSQHQKTKLTKTSCWDYNTCNPNLITTFPTTPNLITTLATQI